MSVNRIFNLKILILLAVVLLLSAVTGCGDAGVFLSGGGETRYRTERTIYLPMEKVRTLNPMISKDEDTYFISKLVYDGLFELDGRLEPQKNLADSYSYNEDGSLLTVSLKHGVKWHDGRELTATDVKFSIDSYISLSYSGETTYSKYVENIRSVSLVKSDQYKFTVSFRSADNIGPENLVFPILPAHQYRRLDDMRRGAGAFIPVGTGAYRVSEYNDLSKLVLSANTEYFGSVPENGVEFTVFPQKSDALKLINTEKISMVFNDDTDRDTLTSSIDVNTVNFVSNQAEFLGFNMRGEIMRDKKMRQAVAYATDSRGILENAYLNSGVLSDTIYYPYYFGNKNDLELYAYNLEIAATLINEVGMKDGDGDGYLDGADGNAVQIRILVNSGDPQREAVAQTIKNALDKLSIDSYIIYCGWNEYLSALAVGEYEIYVGGYSFNERYDLRNLLHSGYGNTVGYSNAEVDSLLDEMQSGITNERKAEAFESLNAILKDEIPYYCILYKTYGAISENSLTGEINPLFNNYYNDCEGWARVYEISAAVAE